MPVEQGGQMRKAGPGAKNLEASEAPADTRVYEITSIRLHYRLFMKLFKSSNIDVVKCCQDHFGFDLPSVSWSKRVKKFEAKFHACNNLLCKITYR